MIVGVITFGVLINLMEKGRIGFFPIKRRRKNRMNIEFEQLPFPIMDTDFFCSILFVLCTEKTR